MSGTNVNPLSSVSESTQILPIVPGDYWNEPKKKYHRIRELRQDMRMSLAYCAKKLGITTLEAREQEDPHKDLNISQLLAWRDILDVPLSEIIEYQGEVEDPIKNRALLLRAMKTVKQIQKTAREERVQNMSITLIDQLTELMPELINVSPWPDIGQAHENRDYGQAAYRRFDPAVAQKLEQ